MLYIKAVILIFLYSNWTFILADEIYLSSENDQEEFEDYTALSNDIVDKLDKLVESIDMLQQNDKFVIKTINTMQQKLVLIQLSLEKKSTYVVQEDDVAEVKCSHDRPPTSCYEVSECNFNIYNIMIPTYSNSSVAVSCDLCTDNGGWTVIQRRKDGSVNFYRNWSEYAEGFGNLNGEFFIGLEKLHVLTTQQPQELFIQLEDFEGVQRYAKYTKFEIDSAANDYKLTVYGYSGNAGDALSYHNGQKFSTWDHDSDESHCAETHRGGWWYNNCYESNLNGKYIMGKLSKSRYGHGISWRTFRGFEYSLKFSQMMIRPRID